MRYLFLILAVSGTVALAGFATAAVTTGPTNDAMQAQSGVKLAQKRGDKQRCPKGTRWSTRNNMCVPTG